jgi:glycosyltransferase involved in cell wall biosynthesis
MTNSSKPAVPISGLVVAHNEESMIEEALKTLDFCDEIVVVLDKCTDKTKEIASKYTKNILEGEWELEGKRRNLGIDNCKYKWILELDADERVSPELREAITEHVKTAPDGYVLLPIHNYIGKRWVQYGWAGSFGTSKAKKLFTKGAKIWGNQRAHPSLTLSGKESEITTGGIIHLVDKDINDMIDRLKRYSDWVAADMVESGTIMPMRTAIRKGFTRFYKSYLSRKGYKEGQYGFLLALMAGLFPILSTLKASLENQKVKEG